VSTRAGRSDHADDRQGAPAGQAANLLGAMSLLVTDRVHDAVTRHGHATNDATALSALLHLAGDPTIDRLAHVIGLSSSGTVRLVDRLEQEGFVRRTGDEDGRTTVVLLTAAGRRRAKAITVDRREVLDDALAVLSPAERRQFGELAGRVTAGLIRPEAGAVRWTCRLCDTSACGRYDGACPVGNEASRRLGTTQDGSVTNRNSR